MPRNFAALAESHPGWFQRHVVESAIYFFRADTPVHNIYSGLLNRFPGTDKLIARGLADIASAGMRYARKLMGLPDTTPIDLDQIPVVSEAFFAGNENDRIVVISGLTLTVNSTNTGRFNHILERCGEDSTVADIKACIALSLTYLAVSLEPEEIESIVLDLLEIYFLGKRF
jgi:hypothetical protein